jgi:hypothetical protein
MMRPAYREASGGGGAHEENADIRAVEPSPWKRSN